MKQYKDIILHGASLFRQLKAGHPNGSRAAVSVAAAGSGARRALGQRAGAGDDFFSMLGGGDEGDDFVSSWDVPAGDDFWVKGVGGGEDWDVLGGDDFWLEDWDVLGDDDFSWGKGDEGDDFIRSSLGVSGGESAGDDLFSLLGGADEYLEQCGIDVNDMMNKAIGAYFLYGPGLNLDNLVNPDNFDPSSIPSLEDVAPMLLAFKDDDEEACTAEDIAKQVLASENFLQCSGADEVFDPENSNLELELQGTLQDVEDACKPAFDSLLSSGGDLSDDFFDEDSDLGKSTKLCLKSVLGDNLIGNLIRYEYKNLDKILGCTKSYSEELPSCVLSAPIKGGTSFSLPLSLYKKMYCLIGETSDVVIEGICTDLYETLDEDLPWGGATTEEYFYYPSGDQFLGIDISIITGDELPDYCLKIYEDQGMDGAGLQSRFEYYNVHREHGWTIEPSSKSPQVKAKFPDVSLATSARNWEDGEATRETATAKTTAFLIGGGVGFAVLAIGAVAFYLKLKKTERLEHLYFSRAFGDPLV